MKKIIFVLFAFATLFLLTQCKNPAPEKLCSNAETRGKIISTLMNNDVYMKEVMDSMMHNNHGMQMMAGNQGMMGMMMSDSSMQTMMMNNMMRISDSSKYSVMSDMMFKNKGMMKFMMQKMNQKGMMDKACMEKTMMNMMGEPEKNSEPKDQKHHQK